MGKGTAFHGNLWKINWKLIVNQTEFHTQINSDWKKNCKSLQARQKAIVNSLSLCPSNDPRRIQSIARVRRKIDMEFPAAQLPTGEKSPAAKALAKILIVRPFLFQ